MEPQQPVSEGPLPPFPTPAFLPPDTDGSLPRCSLWVGSEGTRAAPAGTASHLGEGQSPGCGQAGGKAGLKYGACASYSSPFGVLIAVLEGAIPLWQKSYGSFPSLASKVLKLMTFYCFFSSSPLITWPPYIAAADKIYT